jgi:hypothetical protein
LEGDEDPDKEIKEVSVINFLAHPEINIPNDHSILKSIDRWTSNFSHLFASDTTQVKRDTIMLLFINFHQRPKQKVKKFLNHVCEQTNFGAKVKTVPTLFNFNKGMLSFQFILFNMNKLVSAIFPDLHPITDICPETSYSNIFLAHTHYSLAPDLLLKASHCVNDSNTWTILYISKEDPEFIFRVDLTFSDIENIHPTVEIKAINMKNANEMLF